jgi:hypothetical protein
MADSHALALLADPNKVDVGKPKDEEMPSGVSDVMSPMPPRVNSTSGPPSTPPPVPPKSSSTNVIDLLEETNGNRFEGPKKTLSEETPKKTEDSVFDLSDIQVNESSSIP